MNQGKCFSSLGLVSATVFSLTVIGSPSQAVSVGFDQISWGDGTGGFQDQFSQWGQATVSFSSGDAASLAPFGSGYIGWVNIVTSVSGGSNNNWAVENEPVVFKSLGDLTGNLPFSLNFDLGQPNGTVVTNLGYSYTLSGSPLTAQPSGPLTSVGVAAFTAVAGNTTNFLFQPHDALA